MNTITMGLEVDLGIYPEARKVFKICENAFCIIFLAEMIVKLYAYKADYFRNSWNLLDFGLVFLSILDVWILSQMGGGSDESSSGDDEEQGLKQFSVLRVLRLLRVMRIARLFKFLKELWLILKGILDSFRTLAWVSLLLVVVLYICSIFFTQMIGKAEGDPYGNFPEGYIGEDFNR